MSRGYSYTTLPNNQVAKSVTEIQQGELLTVHYQDGQVITKVQEIEEGE